ncbi:MAG: Na/Pi cotransporter family protein [Halieaceae bacterium]|jgi:phosphate:Na+ symporter|nr:Na/Pi cotransporter family protein [Halieaceae bacterium]
MSDPINFGAMLINVAGGLALFLYGMHKMTEALKILAGERAKDILAKLTSNRFSAAFAGAAITAVIQSSSITTVLMVGFITAGIMTFQQSIGVILGANVGTTFTAQIIAFKITKGALFLIAIGFFTEVFAKRPKLKHLGVALMGLGMLFFGMELMSQATSPLRTYEPFMDLIQEMTNPFFGVAIGAVFTALVQSSSATTGIVIVMASQGLITLETGIALILGSNIGTCVTAWISSIGKPREAMQAAAAHIVFNVTGVLLFVGIIPHYAELIREISPAAAHLEGIERLAADTPRQIANAHTVFNVFNLVIFLGFTNTLAALVLRLVPPVPAPAAVASEPIYLDKMYLSQPAMAFDRVLLELVRVGDEVLGMIKDSFPALITGSHERLVSLQRRGEEVSVLTDAIVFYLRRLATGELVEPHPIYLQQQLGMANYLEKIADIIENAIVVDGFKRLQHRLEVDEETEELLREIYKVLYLATQTTMEAMAENNADKANEITASKDHFNGLVERARGHLYAQLRSDQPEEIQEYKLEWNTLENFRHIHTMLRSICKLIVQRNAPINNVTEAADEKAA